MGHLLLINTGIVFLMTILYVEIRLLYK